MIFRLPQKKPVLETHIVSYGGVGTTLLINFLSNYTKTNHPHNQDGLKHKIKPSKFNRASKNIFVLGDPVLTIISLFKRGIYYHHAIGIQNQLKIKTKIPQDLDLSQYSNCNKDIFYFERFIDNWILNNYEVELLVVKFDSIWDHLNELQEYLNLPHSIISSFPKKRQRNSTLQDLDKDDIEKLTKTYCGTIRKIEQMQELFIINKK